MVLISDKFTESLASHFSPLSPVWAFFIGLPILNSQTMAMFHFAGMIIRDLIQKSFEKLDRHRGLEPRTYNNPGCRLLFLMS